VDSTVGSGTVFTIDLPATSPPDDSGGSPPSPQPTTAPPAESTPADAGWILVVDDDDMVRSTTCALIESLGYTVAVAAGGTDAIALVAQSDTPPSVVLTDLSMPEMDGLQLVSALRSSGYAGAAAVITGYGEDAFDTAREVGVDRVLRKPISRAELGKAIADLLPDTAS
jgi:CheY-like chemotaxis protein